MLIELKRCNSVGNINGLLFLISIIAGKQKINRSEIINRCALENGVYINCPGAIAFLEYLGLVGTTEESVKSTDSLNELASSTNESIIQKIAFLSISKLVEDGIFDRDAIGFDSDKGHLTIKRSAFPLDYAAIRNFLIAARALGKEENGEICVTESYESAWTCNLRNRRKQVTLEQLLKQQEEKNRRGLEAEEFVLRLEKERLPAKSDKIKRISDFDVSAGYDIVSFKNEGSSNYDLFIEVKCYLGNTHFFWSENEIDVAKIKRQKYILCLVDYEKINKPEYIPEYIFNPYEAIFDSEQWMITPASYRIDKI